MKKIVANRVFKLAAIVSGAAVAAVVLAPSAVADENQYIKRVDKRSVPYSSVYEALQWGNTFCADLRSGVSVDQAHANLIYRFPRLQRGDRGWVMGAAALYLCRDQLEVVRPWMNHFNDGL